MIKAKFLMALAVFFASSVSAQSNDSELVSANKMAKAGLAMYCVGGGIEAAGVSLLAISIGDEKASLRIPGIVMFATGSGLSLAGHIYCCAEGTKAHRRLIEKNSKAPIYLGWAFFGLSQGFGIASCISGVSDISVMGGEPDHTGRTASLAAVGFAFGVASVVYPVCYTKRALFINGKTSNLDFRLIPTANMKKKSVGAEMVMTF